MTIVRRCVRGLPSAILAALGFGPLCAGTVSGTMAVTATVEESCNLDVRPMVFGAVPGKHDDIDASSSLVLACTPAASYVVTLDHGRHGNYGARRMADATGTRFLAYELYRDAARTRRWGAAMEDAVSGFTPAGGRIEFAVYGKLAAAPAVAGAYGDTVTVTVSF